VSTTDVKANRMKALHKTRPKRVMNSAMGCKRAQAIKCRRPHPDPKMGFPALSPTRVTPMFFAFVRHQHLVRRKGGAQLDLYFFRQPHFFTLPPSKPRQNT